MTDLEHMLATLEVDQQAGHVVEFKGVPEDFEGRAAKPEVILILTVGDRTLLVSAGVDSSGQFVDVRAYDQGRQVSVAIFDIAGMASIRPGRSDDT